LISIPHFKQCIGVPPTKGVSVFLYCTAKNLFRKQKNAEGTKNLKIVFQILWQLGNKYEASGRSRNALHHQSQRRGAPMCAPVATRQVSDAKGAYRRADTQVRP
jgi:hypothetical protein